MCPGPSLSRQKTAADKIRSKQKTDATITSGSRFDFDVFVEVNDELFHNILSPSFVTDHYLSKAIFVSLHVVFPGRFLLSIDDGGRRSFITVTFSADWKKDI